MEYQRRIMEEIIEEILDEDGSIKPEYSDDPVARFLRDHELRQEIVASVNDKEQRLNNGEDFGTVRAEAQSEIASSLNAADAYASNAQTEQLVVDGDKGHDGFRDSDAQGISEVRKPVRAIWGRCPFHPY